MATIDKEVSMKVKSDGMEVYIFWGVFHWAHQFLLQTIIIFLFLLDLPEPDTAPSILIQDPILRLQYQ